MWLQSFSQNSWRKVPVRWGRFEPWTVDPKSYKIQQSTMESQRIELAKAEKLFDLLITSFPELLEVDKEISALDKIYSVYEEQTKVDPRDWTSTLGANLNMKTLSDSIDKYIEKLDKFSNEINAMLVCQNCMRE